MNGEFTTTTTTTAIQITGPEAETEGDVSLGAEFRYDPADPLAVTMVLESISGPVRWTFARDLILNTQFEPTGDGDVHVGPCLDTERAAVVIIELDVDAWIARLLTDTDTTKQLTQSAKVFGDASRRSAPGAQRGACFVRHPV